MRLKGILYYQYALLRYTSIVFWMILFGFILLGTSVSVIISSQSIYYTISVPVYVFLGVIGFWSVKNIFPFLLKVGCSRKNIFLGTGLGFLIFIVLFNLVSNFITFGGNEIFNLIFTKDTHIMGHFVEFFMPDPWWLLLMIDIGISSFLLSVCLLLGLIFYRYGLVGGFATLAVGILALLFTLPQLLTSERLHNFGLFIVDHTVFVFLGMFLIALVIYGCTYFLTRRIEVN